MNKRMLFHVILLLTFAWGGFSGCSGDDSASEPVPVEAVEVTDRYDDERIYFTIGANFYTGYVVEGVSETEVLVLLDDRTEMIISLDRIGGAQIDDHPDINADVAMAGELKDENQLLGVIVDVFTDGVRKIVIYGVIPVNGPSKVLDRRRTRFVHEDLDYEKGGYRIIKLNDVKLRPDDLDDL